MGSCSRSCRADLCFESLVEENVETVEIVGCEAAEAANSARADWETSAADPRIAAPVTAVSKRTAWGRGTEPSVAHCTRT